MPMLYIVCGLPASGKTHVCNQLIERHQGDITYLATDDQFPRNPDGTLYWVDTDGNHRSWTEEPIHSQVLTDAFRTVMEQLYQETQRGHDVVVEDVFPTSFVRMVPSLIASWSRHNYDVETIYCRTGLRRCQQRNYSRQNRVPPEVLSLVEMQFRPPESSEGYVVIADDGKLPDECQECAL